MRHEVICRRCNEPKADLQEFVTLTLQHGEDGRTWGRADVKGFKLEAHVAALIERTAGLAPSELPDITITTRSAAEVEAEPPLTQQLYGLLLDIRPGASLSILAPIRHEEGQRTKFETWTCVSRAGGRIFCSGEIKFVVAVLANEIKRSFNDAEDRVAWSPTTYKQFAGQTTYERSEVWIRPGWIVANPEFLPGVFPLLKPAPVIAPEVLALKADRDAFNRRKKAVRGMWKSRGYAWNSGTQSWSPPKE